MKIPVNGGRVPVSVEAYGRVFEPGKCAVCGAFGMITREYPYALHGAYVELCDNCVLLDDAVIVRHVIERQPPRRDGAEV